MVKRSRSEADESHLSIANSMDTSDVEEDETFANDTLKHSEGADLVDPKTMLDLMMRFEEYVKKVGKSTTHRLMPNVAADFLKTTEHKDSIDGPKFIRSFKEFSARASRELDLGMTISCNLHFLRNGSSAKLFPDYPKSPPSLIDYYVAKNNLPKDVRYRGDTKTKLVEDVRGREDCERELLELEDKFIVELEAFLASHRAQMHEKQADYVTDQLRKYRKKFGGATPKAKKVKKEAVAKENVTGFDLFKKSMAEKYLDLEPEAREKKLLKKYNKLEESSRDILERLALH